ncbi:hypothetical protein U1872_03310 [Sphingomonas sp. RB3P16]|uniref:hypothetical protein n=1 Tax=Parasphingomonas frigoris TaxID=3096163 RepID=UPI002FC5FCE0
MFVLISIFVSGSIGASAGFVIGGLMASGKVSDLESRVYLLERLITKLTGEAALPAEVTDFR